MKFKDNIHDSAISHVSGASEFIDDVPIMSNELHAVIFFSPVTHAEITDLNVKEAQKSPGVVGIFTYRDIINNSWGSIINDQPYLAQNKVHYFGEPIAVVAARTLEQAYLAREKILLSTNNLEPILSIKKAREQRCFLGDEQKINCGDLESIFNGDHHFLEGTFTSAGQEQFYLESQATIAYPEENECLRICSSSQHPTEVQHMVANSLGLEQHQVTCVVKRMGGAFGGKESQAGHFAVLAALVAKKTGCPTRLCLNKDDDMKMTGKRHPFENDYKVAFNEDGRILGLRVAFFADGGAYADLSPAILQRALFHVDNAYYLENAEISGRICKTNFAPNTAFRGFGGPQWVAVIESIIEEIAYYLKTDALEIRKLNCYQVGRNRTHYGQILKNNTLPKLFEILEEKSNYKLRRKEIQKFNANNLSEVRGLSMTAVKFGISFTTRFLNQGNALVNLHRDGTVQVSTGATEMGQGVNTKIQGIVSEAFGIKPSKVRLMPTSTEKNHNTSATAASSGSDINGAAALNACNEIKQNLANIALQLWAGKKATDRNELEIDLALNSDHVNFVDGNLVNSNDAKQVVSLVDVIDAAYFSRISLGAYGYYKTPGIWFEKSKGQGEPFLYFTNGVALSEVSIDRFTGEVKVLRSDILMDLGRSINDGIDYGQTAGGFIQGMGWVTTESLVYNEKGELLSFSPTTYKIPNIQDIPRQFNIDFIENKENICNIRGSKAVGEPPLLLSISIWTAIKNALQEFGRPNLLKLPATQEEVLNCICQGEQK